MKRFFLAAILMLVATVCPAATTNRTPILRGLLQSNMDGGGTNSITNLDSVTAGAFIGDGSQLTGIGTNSGGSFAGNSTQFTGTSIKNGALLTNIAVVAGLTLFGQATITNAPLSAIDDIYSDAFFKVDSAEKLAWIGDKNGDLNGTSLALDDDAQTMTIVARNGISIAGNVAATSLTAPLIGAASTATNLIGNLPIGQVTGINTNAYTLTYDLRPQNFSNNVSSIGVSNIYVYKVIFITNANALLQLWGFQNIQWGNSDTGSTNLASMFFNPYHGGIGTGSEMQYSGESVSINLIPGGRFQFGFVGTSVNSPAQVMYEAQAGSPNANWTQVPSDLHGQQFGWWDGSAFHLAMTSMQAVPMGTNGASQILFRDADYANNAAQFSTNGAARFGLLSGIGTITYGNGLFSRSTVSVAPTGTLLVPLIQKYNDAFLNGAATISVTNTSILNLTNTAESEVKLYPGLAKAPLTFSIPNLIWESEFGTEIAQTNVPFGSMLHLKLTAEIGNGITNVFANYRLATYAQPVDASAASFFAQELGAVNATESNAVNNFVIALKQANLWTNWDCIYPFVGRTATACAWNLVNTNLYKVTWSGSGLTFDANGVTSTGASGVGGKTTFNPSTATTPRYNATNVSLVVFNKTTGLTTGAFLSSFGGGTTRSGIQVSSLSDFSIQGVNSTSAAANGVAAAPDTGVIAVTLQPGTTLGTANQFIYVTSTAQSNGGQGFTAPTLPASNPFGILARFDGSVLDQNCAADLGIAMIGSGLSASQVGVLTGIINNFETSLGR